MAIGLDFTCMVWIGWIYIELLQFIVTSAQIFDISLTQIVKSKIPGVENVNQLRVMPFAPNFSLFLSSVPKGYIWKSRVDTGDPISR